MSDNDKVVGIGERFTIYLNTDGNPVERSVGDMTETEVHLALEWSERERERLVAEVETDKPEFEAAMKLIKAKDYTSVRLSVGEVERIMTTMEALIAATEREGRLLGQVMAAIMPAWNKHEGMPLETALRQFWPRA